MDESDLIRLFLDAMPPDRGHSNAFFSSDAEILDCDGGPMLFTVDSFDREDHFPTGDAGTLGHNLAACTVSDIFASGGSVRFYGHSATIAEQWDAPYITALSRGIADVLRECGATFAGGDLGLSSRWHYTGIAFGHAERPVTRCGASPDDRLYVTGPLGAGNLLAAAELLPARGTATIASKDLAFRFPLRHREARLVARHASACIDTSDGLLRSLAILAELNGTGYDIHSLPWLQPARMAMESYGLPVELLAAGECGEYELLCCIPPEREEQFLRDAASDGCSPFPIGRLAGSGRRLHGASGFMTLDDYDLTARRFASRQEYLERMIDYFQKKHA